MEFKRNFFLEGGWGVGGVKYLLRQLRRRLKHNVKKNTREVGYESGSQMAVAAVQDCSVL